MSKHENKKIEPELRFKNDDGSSFTNWKVVRLKSVAKRRIEKNKGEKITRVLTNSAVDGVVDQRDYFDKDIAVKGNLESYCIVDQGDYVYNPRISSTAPVGPISKNKLGKGVMSPLYTVFRFNRENNDFYEHFFKSSKWHSYLRTVSNTGTRHDRMSISADDFMAMPVPCSDENEQKKIADCLSSIDNLVTAQSQKLEALKAHKKGLMQKLFPAEGETAPKVRFSEFRGEGKWCLVPLGDQTSKVGSGITPRGGDKNYKSTGRPFVRSQNIGWGDLILNDVVYIDETTHSSFSATQIEENDVLLNITGASIGRTAIADKRIVGGNVNQHVCIIRTNVTELNPTFLSQFILSTNGQKQIDSFQAGGNREGLNFSQIRSFLIPVPPNIKEQQKIADCLASIDELIAAQNNKIEVLKMHKKGLLQQLFPILGGV